jgi:hypothetical protein
MTDHEFTLLPSGITVIFTEYSGVEFYDEYNHELFMLSPTELSIVYGAYQNMLREEREKNIDNTIKGGK